MEAHEREHHRSRPRLGGGRKRGALGQAFGRSRGGFTSKIHARSDNQGRPIGFILTGGEASDYAAADDLMALPLPTPKGLLRSEEHTSELQSLMRISYAVFCLKKKSTTANKINNMIDTYYTMTLTSHVQVLSQRHK